MKKKFPEKATAALLGRKQQMLMELGRKSNTTITSIIMTTILIEKRVQSDSGSVLKQTEETDISVDGYTEAYRQKSDL